MKIFKLKNLIVVGAIIGFVFPLFHYLIGLFSSLNFAPIILPVMRVVMDILEILGFRGGYVHFIWALISPMVFAIIGALFGLICGLIYFVIEEYLNNIRGSKQNEKKD